MNKICNMEEGYMNLFLSIDEVKRIIEFNDDTIADYRHKIKVLIDRNAIIKKQYEKAILEAGNVNFDTYKNEYHKIKPEEPKIDWWGTIVDFLLSNGNDFALPSDIVMSYCKYHKISNPHTIKFLKTKCSGYLSNLANNRNKKVERIRKGGAYLYRLTNDWYVLEKRKHFNAN